MIKARISVSHRMRIDEAPPNRGLEIGLVVDAATLDLVAFYEKFGFRRILSGSKRLFLPTRSLVEGED